jgi:hypothetical protein
MLDHLKDVETTEESTRCWSLLDGRYLATYAAQKTPSSSAAKGLVYYVPGAVVWKSRRIAATNLLQSTYDVVASRRVVGDAELNPPQRAELHPPNKHIHHKETAHIETRYRRQNRRSETGPRISSRSRLPRLDKLQQQLLYLQKGGLDSVNPLSQVVYSPVCLVYPRRKRLRDFVYAGR